LRSLQITGPGKFEIVEMDPPACGAGEVLIEIKACTICNQHDAAVLAGRPHGGRQPYPLEAGYPGHEGAGVVVAIGEGAGDLSVGDRVVTTGIGGPPLYSEYVTRRADAAVRFPAGIDFVRAAPLELFGCVHRAFTLTRPVAGLRVGVAGLGPAGQAMVALARALGATEVVGFDLDPARRQLAGRMGATAVVDAAPLAGAHQAAKARLRGEDAVSAEQRGTLAAVEENACEIVFDCTGSARGLETSFLLAKADLTVFGFVAEPVEALPALWFQRELTIRNSKILRISDLRAVTEMLADGRIDTAPVVTEVMGFGEYAAAVAKVQRREAVKIALTWE